MTFFNIFFAFLITCSGLQSSIEQKGESLLEKLPFDITKKIFTHALLDEKRNGYFEDCKETISMFRTLCTYAKNVFSQLNFKNNVLKEILYHYSIETTENNKEFNVNQYSGKLNVAKIKNKSVVSWYSLNQELDINLSPKDILSYIFNANTTEKGDYRNSTTYLKDVISILNVDFTFLLEHYNKIVIQNPKDYKFREKFCWFIQVIILNQYLSENKVEQLIGMQETYLSEKVMIKIVKSLIQKSIETYLKPNVIKEYAMLHFYPEYYGTIKGKYLLHCIKKIGYDDNISLKQGYYLLYVFNHIKKRYKNFCTNLNKNLLLIKPAYYILKQHNYFNESTVPYIYGFLDYKKLMKKIIKHIPSDLFFHEDNDDGCLRFDNELVTTFANLMCIDKQYADRCFNAWFEFTLKTYYESNDFSDKRKSIVNIGDTFIRRSLLACPLFYKDEKGETIYEKLCDLHEDFVKNNVYDDYNLGSNIALQALRQYFSAMSIEDFKAVKSELEKIIDDVAKIAGWEIKNIFSNNLLESLQPICLVQQLLYEYDPLFARKVFPRFLFHKYGREFTKKEIKQNPPKTIVQSEYLFDLGNIRYQTLDLDFQDVDLFFEIIMKLFENNKFKQAFDLLKQWTENNPEKIHYFLDLVYKNKNRILFDKNVEEKTFFTLIEDLVFKSNLVRVNHFQKLLRFSYIFLICYMLFNFKPFMQCRFSI